ncbi:MAG: hypothetical protein WCD88_00345, partial [Desulfobacterales bacterium]
FEDLAWWVEQDRRKGASHLVSYPWLVSGNFNYRFQANQAPVVIAHLTGYFGEHCSGTLNLIGQQQNILHRRHDIR